MEIFFKNSSNLQIEECIIYVSGICEYVYSHYDIKQINNYRNIKLEKISENIYYIIIEWNMLDLKFYFKYKSLENLIFNTKEYEINYLEFEKLPKNWNESIYFIMIDRFIENLEIDKWQNDDFYAGGTFADITNDLPRIADDGYSMIYLSPIMTSLSYHGYNQTSFNQINNLFGGKKKLLELIDEMKKYNLKLGIEIVLNHFSVFSNEFKECLKGKNDLFYINERFDYEMYRDCVDLAKIKYNYENRKMVLNYLILLIEELNIKFIRLDCCDYLDVVLVNKLAEYCNEKSILLTGECWSNYNNFFNRYLVHGATNYKLYGYINRLFIDKNITINEFQQLLIDNLFEQGFQKNNSMLNFLDNHDVMRISHLVDDKNQLLNMLSFIFMYIGIPVIYYGTENYSKDIKSIVANRRCFFKNNISREIENHIKNLNKIRKKFINDKVYFESKDELLIFSRDIEHGKIKYIYNNSDEEISMFGEKIGGYSSIIYKQY